MIRGLTTAASGMLANERLQELLANNLANSNTPGFKSSDGELRSFSNQLLQAMNYGDTSGRGIGKLGTGVVLQEGVPLFIQGQLTNSNRSLDVAIVDNTPSGTYAVLNPGATAATGTGATQAQGASAARSATGTITAGPTGRIEMNGTPIAVTDGNGNTLKNVYAMKNPAYKGTALVSGDGKPNYDPSGNPSYVFVDQNNRIIGQADQPKWENAGLQIGSNIDMGNHAFFAVAYQSPEGPSGIALTRNGHFDVNAQHELVDASGNAILPVDQSGKPLTNARIVINPNYSGTDLFAADGRPVTYQGQTSYTVVSATGQAIPNARLGTVAADVTQLTPLGQSEFMVNQTLNPNQVLANLRPSTASMKPGEIEQGNVDTTATMTQMLSVMAQYQANQEVIKTEDSELAKAVSDVGKVNA